MSNRELRWQIGKQLVVQSDCLAEMKKMSTASVDVICTSPPYNIDVDYHQHDDRKPRAVYLDWLGERFTEFNRVLKPNGSFFLNIGIGTKDDMTLPYAIIDRALAAGHVLQNRIVWVKAIAAADGVVRGHNKPVNSPLYLTRMFEDVLHFTKHANVPLDKLAIGVPYADKSNIARRGHAQDLRDRGNVWYIDYATVQSKSEKFNHPAGFPVELPTWCIMLHGLRPNLVVLDPFLGAGTTLVATQQLGCHGIGIEIDSQYVETARKRLGDAPTAAVPAHSRIGPSQAELIWHCGGSVKAQEAAGPRVAGEAAKRGTTLHTLAEDCLRTGAKSTDSTITPYVEAVRSVATRAGVTPLLEQRLDLAAWHPELFGTADALVIDLAEGALTVFDFKSGLIHVAADALQLRIYAGMSYMSLPAADQHKIKYIETVVVQPANGSLEPVRRVRHTVADVVNTLGTFVDRAHVATDSKDPPRTAGPWCRGHFCAARTVCPAFHALTVREAQEEFSSATATGSAST
jgi:site-specific DNA-methyltransferase (adenine-specific)